MNRRLKKYFPFTKGAMQNMIAYRASLFVWFVLDILYVLISYFTWKAVYISSGESTIEGFTFGAMVSYILIRALVAGTVYMTISDQLVDDFKDGTIAVHLIKPLDYRIQMLFFSLGHNAVFLLMFTIPYIVILWGTSFFIDLGLVLTFTNVLFFVLSLILSFLLNYLIAFVFGIIVFYTFNGFGIWQLKEAVTVLLSGYLIPLSFYPDWLYKITQYTPFSSVIYAPVSILMNLNTNYVEVILFQGMWVLVMYLFMVWFWNRTKSRMLVQGG